MNKYMVLRKAETQPLEAWEFQEKADAVAHFDRASWQWSDTYLCEVLAGPGKPLTTPSPDVDFETALADFVGAYMERLESEPPPIEKFWAAKKAVEVAHTTALTRARAEEREKILTVMRKNGPKHWSRDPEHHAIQRYILDVEEALGITKDDDR